MIAQQFGVELRRILHRRVLKAFLVTGLVVLVVVGVSTYLTTGAEDRYFENYDDTGFETVERTFCPSSLVTTFQDYSFQCPESTPTVIPGETSFEGAPAPYSPWNGSIAMFTVAMLLVVWILVARLVGEEFRHGTVETALVAEPRRARLLTLRLCAVVTVSLAACAVLLVGYLVAVAPAWWFHGIQDTTVPVSLLAAAGARALLAAFLVALLAGSLAVVGRGALTAVGALVAFAILSAVFFLFVRVLVPLEFFTNAWALVTGGDGMRAYTVSANYGQGDFGLTSAVTVTQFGAGWPWVASVAVVAAYVAGALALAYATFLQRDIR